MGGEPTPMPVTSESSLEELRAWAAADEEDFTTVMNTFVEGKGFENVEDSERTITGDDGNHIQLYISKPKDAAADLPCILHIHGGGMATLSAASASYTWWRQALANKGHVVVGVEFRNSAGKLGPHPFPAGLNDCTSALRWTHDNLSELGASKIVVSGESGGGNLCLATALKAKRDGNIGQLAGIYAQCPYIAGPQVWSSRETLSMEENDGYFLDGDMMEMMGKLYDYEGANAKNPLCWPSEASIDDLKGLPPVAISLNELDPCRDEGLEFARQLARAGVPSYSRVVVGTWHASDIVPIEGTELIVGSTLSDIASFAASL